DGGGGGGGEAGRKLDEKTGDQQRAVTGAVTNAQNIAADPGAAAMRDTEAGRAASQTRDRVQRQVSQVENLTPDQVADQAVGSQRAQAPATVDRVQREGGVGRPAHPVVAP